MKILFITPFNFSSLNYGGALCSYRNYESLKKLYNNVDLFVVEKWESNSLIDRIRRAIKKIYYHSEYNLFDIDNFYLDQYDLFFIDGSFLGYYARYLRGKKTTGKIITFFHNCEYDYYKQFFSKKNYLARKINNKCAFVNEYNALLYSDKCIALNLRDVNAIKNIYKRNIDSIIPISFHDRYPKTNTQMYLNTPPLFLFIGSYFYGNVLGIKWFINEVLPFVDIKFVIIGKDMDKLKQEIKSSDKMSIYSSVKDISSYIQSADCMLFPIFDGSGMKVKTCESLMYGKYIIGTPEAFEGYDIDYKKIGDCCKTKEEFIAAINNFIETKQYKYNQYSRDIFLKKYSFEATLNLFEKTISELFIVNKK